MLKKLTWGIKFLSNSTVAGQYHIVHYAFSHPREVELSLYLEFSVYWLQVLAKRQSLLVLGIIGSYIPLTTLYSRPTLCARGPPVTNAYISPSGKPMYFHTEQHM